jgi:hypothetical protein
LLSNSSYPTYSDTTSIYCTAAGVAGSGSTTYGNIYIHNSGFITAKNKGQSVHFDLKLSSITNLNYLYLGCVDSGYNNSDSVRYPSTPPMGTRFTFDVLLSDLPSLSSSKPYLILAFGYSSGSGRLDIFNMSIE